MLRMMLAAGIYCLIVAFSETALANDSRTQCSNTITPELYEVGETRVQVLFFKVYDASLKTDTGAYPDYAKLQLQLQYLRDIKSEALVQATAEQWQKLGFSNSQQSQNWLNKLQQIWPDVSKGDCLIAEHNKAEGITFYMGNQRLGELTDETFAERFLAIWLAAESSFKRNRDELVGLK